MSWLEEVDDETLKMWVKHCPSQKLVSRISGEILWANPAFLEWSQYTLGELRQVTWMQISVPDKHLEADIDETKRLDAFNPSYTVKKQYIPKGNKPEWGSLTVMRYPPTGEIKYCLCTWDPLKNGTATAFAHAMEHTQKVDDAINNQAQTVSEAIQKMTTELAKLTTQTEEDTFWLSLLRMIRKHPKMAMAFIVLIISLTGAENVVSILRSLGYLPQQPVKIEQGYLVPIEGDQDARQIARTGKSNSWSDSVQPATQDRIATTIAGVSATYDIGRHRTVTVTEPRQWASRSMLGAAERGRRESCGDCGTQCTTDSAGRDACTRGRSTFGTPGDFGSVSFGASGVRSEQPTGSMSNF